MRKNWLAMVVAVIAMCTPGAMANWVDTFDGAAGAAWDSAWTATDNTVNGAGFGVAGAATDSTFRDTGIAKADLTVGFTFKVTDATGSYAYISLVDSNPSTDYIGLEITNGNMQFLSTKAGVNTRKTKVALTNDTLYDVKYQASTTTNGWWSMNYKEHSSDTWLVSASVYNAGLNVNKVKVLMSGNSSVIQIDKISAVPEPATMSLLAIGGIAALIRRRRA